VDHDVVQAFKEVVNLTLDQYMDAVNSFQELQDPPQGWLLREMTDLVRHACVESGSLIFVIRIRSSF
jgi:hypothetical protein